MAEDEDMLSEDEIDELLDESEESEGAEAVEASGGDISIDNIRSVYDEIADSMEDILGTILNREVTNQLVDCQLEELDEIEDQLGERNWVVVESELAGPVEGTARYILPEDQALQLADVMMGQEGDEPPEEFDEVYESAIVEMFNQVVNSLANKLNEITGEDIELNPPESEVMSSEDLLGGLDDDEFLWVEYSFSVTDLVESGLLFELQPYDIAQLIHDSVQTEDEPADTGGGEAPAGGGGDDTSTQQPDSGGTGGSQQAQPQGEGDKEVKNVEFPQFQATEGEEPVGNMNLLMDVPMEVSVELGRTDLQVKEILNLGAGSIIELERLAGEPVDLLVNGRLVARGEVVVIDENFGVRVTSIVSPMERIK